MNKYRDESWDFRKADTKQLTHCFHGYPAMMIPQVAGRLIDNHVNSNPRFSVLDPFCGSGTVMVESKQRGLESWGIDINPLARLIAKVKTTPIEIDKLETAQKRLLKRLTDIFNNPKEFANRILKPNFFNIEYWFKPKVIESLSVIKNEIMKIKDQRILDFFKIIFSETIRDCSNVRVGEFKLFRIPPEKLKRYNPNVISIFLQNAERNYKGMKAYHTKLSNKRYLEIPVFILDEDTRFKTSIQDGSIDLIVTSPPYGDSRTTVAYGQYSRLSLQWLDFEEGKCRTIDKVSLGGQTTNDNGARKISASLNRTLKKIEKIDSKRAKEVLNFYSDMLLCLNELNRVMAPKSNICFVLGNRTVKGIRIPSDEILVEMFGHFGFKHKETIIRDIPNKTMPLKNSPTNEPGKVEKTMWNEFIVIVGR